MFLKFLVCGAIAALPFVFPQLWFLSWVSLIPAVLMLINNSGKWTKRKAYLVGFGFGEGYFLVMYHWFLMLYPMEFAGVEKYEAAILVAVCWLGLALLHSVEFGFVVLIYRIIRPDKEKPLVCGLLFAGLWVIFEWQQTLFWRGVPWARLALTQANAPMLQQSASLFGSIFVSALIVTVNVLLASAVQYAVKKLDKNSIKAIPMALKNRRTVILSSVAVGLFTLNLLFGGIRMMMFNETSDTKVKAAVIQGNISSLEKWGDNSVAFSLERYLTLTEECVRETGAELVVWPESVIPTDLSRQPYVVREISDMTEKLGITLFAGAFDSDQSEGGENGEYNEYNAIYLFYPDGTMAEQRYYKRRLVPFGEYTPMEDFVMAVLPVLGEMNILSDPLTPGTDSEVFDTAFGKVGSLICFDSIYELLALDSVRDGAEILTLSTNDSWFGDSAAVWQHNNHAALRAIETGRYIVRAANTGVSSIISPEGKVLTQIEPLITGYSSADIYALSGRTLYSYIGNLFVYLCIAGVAGLFSYNIVMRKKIKKA